MKNDPKPIEDIYRAPNSAEREEDYRWNMPSDLADQIRLSYIKMALSAMLFFGLAIGLTVLISREIRGAALTALPATQRSAEQFVPHYTLPMDEEWVLMYEVGFRRTEDDNAKEEPTLSTKWIKSAAYNIIMGHQALRKEQYQEASAFFERALQIFPDLRDVHEPLGVAYLKQQKFDEAAAALQAAIKENDSFSVLNNLGVALMGAKRFDEAEPFLLQVLAHQPNHPGGQKNLALLYRKMDRPKKALPYFEAYFSLCPEDFAEVELYANYLITLNRRERATAFLKETCQAQSREALPLYLLLAKLEAHATNTAESVEALKNITRYISPNLALTELHHESFDPIRDTEAFENLVHHLELSMVTLENQN